MKKKKKKRKTISANQGKYDKHASQVMRLGRVNRKKN